MSHKLLSLCGFARVRRGIPSESALCVQHGERPNWYATWSRWFAVLGVMVRDGPTRWCGWIVKKEERLVSQRSFVTIDGNEAASLIAHQTNEVIAIYPITPASPMGEFSDAWSAVGRKNIFGTVPDVIEMQSEAGAAGPCTVRCRRVR